MSPMVINLHSLGFLGSIRRASKKFPLIRGHYFEAKAKRNGKIKREMRKKTKAP